MMEVQNKNHKVSVDWFQGIFFLILLLFIVGFTVRIFLPYASALFFGLIASIAFRPVYSYLVSVVKNKNGAAFIATALVLLLFIVPLIVFGILLFNEAFDFYQRGALSVVRSGWVGEVNDRINSTLGRLSPEIRFDITVFIDWVVGWLATNVTTFFSKFFEVILGLFITMFALFYLFRDGDKVLKKLIFLSPLSDRYDEEIFQKIEQAINSVVRGSLVVAVIQGFLSGIGFLIFGLPHPILWASIAMMASLVPSVGTAIVLVPSVLFLYFSGSVGAAIGLLVWGAFAVGFVDNILGTYLIGRGVKIHPFLILLSVIGGISLFGLIGFMAGPVIVSLLFVLLEIYPSILARRSEHTHS